jgi:CelD/BcsL family acetyltransferase involved in cellulose biosynthesis
MADVDIITQTGTALITAPSWEAFAAREGTAFHTSRFLLPWWRDRLAKNPASSLVAAQILGSEGVIGICAFELASGLLSFAGGRDVVDYMGPLALPGREKDVAAALADWMFTGQPWTRASFAGLRCDDAMAQAFADELARRTPAVTVETYDQAPRIGPAPNGYLPLLNSKRRADVLRKRNRLTESVGELELVASTPETVLGSLERLLAWKCDASPATREFVDEYGGFMRAVLAELAAADAAHVVELQASGRPLAAAIMLRHRDTDYIYNMSYDLAFTTGDNAGLAPGIVLVSLLVERSLGRGALFDFLKGAQDYKLRLGGTPVDLIDITVER